MSFRSARVEQVSNDQDNSRLIDSDTGIQSIRGSQRVGSGFLSSVASAYSNLFYHPVALFILGIAIFILLAELNSHDGPLEIALQALIDYAKDIHHPTWLRNLAVILSNIVAAAIKYKIIIATLALIWFTAICKPSARTIVTAIILTAIVLFFKKFSVLEIFVLSQLFYLFVMLRTPSHKAIVAVFFILLFMTETINVDQLHHPLVKSMSDAKLEDLEKDSRARYDTTLQILIHDHNIINEKPVAQGPGPAPATSRPSNAANNKPNGTNTGSANSTRSG